MDKSLPTPKEMMLDSMEFYTRWLLIITSFLVAWNQLSLFLDTYIGVP